MNILFQPTVTCYMTWGKLWFSTPLVKSAKHGFESITFVGPKIWDILHGFYIVIDSLEVLLSFSEGQNHTQETGYFNIPIPNTLIFLTKYARFSRGWNKILSLTIFDYFHEMTDHITINDLQKVTEKRYYSKSYNSSVIR